MDQINEKTSMRFLSFANDKEDAEKEAKLKEASLKIEQAISKQKALSELVDYVPTSNNLEVDPANDTRSLYDRLQEQKNKKKEALEESQRLSNLVTKLDEEDARYLHEVALSKQEEELKKRLEVYDALESKKRANEKKMLDEEKRIKESLIGSRPQSKISPVKSKLSLSIKVKPKSSTQKPHQEHETEPIEEDAPVESGRSTRKSARENNRLDESELEANKKRELRKDTEQRESKRQESDNHGRGSDEDDSSRSDKERLECSCSPMNVMKCIGILPSLPIIDKFNDSSDSLESNNSSDSDESNDDLKGRITLKRQK